MKQSLKQSLIVSLGLLVLFVATHAGLGMFVKRVRDQKFAMHSRSAAGSIFLLQDGKRRFICSGTVFGYMPNGDALFLTARHCVWQDASAGDWDNGPRSAGLLGSEEVSFSDNEAGPYYTATPFKISQTDDVAILELKNGGTLPTVALGDERLLTPGEPLTNYSFPLDLGKMAFRLRAVAPVFAHFPDNLRADYPVWAHSMPVDGTIGHGSSGSALFSVKQRRIVGVVVGTTSEAGLQIAIPVSRVWNLLTDPNVQVIPDPNKPVGKIPDAVFAAQFGKTHPFMLTAHGADPKFIQAGYTFQVSTDGFELSDDYYYNVPVFIDTEGHGYRLVSTKEGYSVSVIVLQEPKAQ